MKQAEQWGSRCLANQRQPHFEHAHAQHAKMFAAAFQLLGPLTLSWQ